MPRHVDTYSTCAGPSVARSSKQLTGLTGTLVTGFLRNPTLTVTAFIAVLIGLVLLSNPIGWAALGAAFIFALVEFKDWYYNGRLLCIRDRDCAIGTVISKPTASFDGDRKLNLMLAPFSQRDWVETLVDHIAANEAMLIDNSNFNEPPFHSTAPILPVAAQRENDFDKLRQYLGTVESSDPDDGDAVSNMYGQLLIGVVHRLMSIPARNFFNRFYRKDSAHIASSSSLWDAIPEDFDDDPAIDWYGPNAQSPATQRNDYSDRTEGLNPMFRFNNSHMVPYLHCEVEGYFIALLMDNLILAFSAWIALVIALWNVAGPLAPLAAAVLGALLFFAKWLIDKFSGNDGDAAEPDIDYQDPEVPDAGVTEKPGDLVVAYGNWIMDTEHHNYFEIHPVRAYYVIAQNSLGVEPVLVHGNLEQEEFGHENFDPRQITAERADEICRIVTKAEEGDTPGKVKRKGSTLLSYGLTTKYAGAGADDRGRCTIKWSWKWWPVKRPR